MLLQPYIPGLVEVLVAEYAATGRPTVPDGRRDEVVRMLMSVVFGPAAATEYAGLLTAAFAGGPAPPQGPADLPPFGVMARDGLVVLSDDQLARIALNREALRDLNGRFAGLWDLPAEEIGRCWVVAYEDLYTSPEDEAGWAEVTRETYERFSRLWRIWHEAREGG